MKGLCSWPVAVCRSRVTTERFYCNGQRVRKMALFAFQEGAIMDHLYKALRKIEELLCFPPFPQTKREMKIYSLACAALNLADGEAIMQAEARAAISAAEPEQQQAGGEG